MQRIYGDGLEHIEEALGDDWLKPEKTINYRSPDRIVILGNAIRARIDGRRQTAVEGNDGGTVRLFLAATSSNPAQVESQARSEMELHSGDGLWVSTETGAMTLILEHALAAHRRGFENIMGAFRQRNIHSQIFSRSVGSPAVRYCSDVLRPLLDAVRTGKAATTEGLLRRHSPLTQGDALRSEETFRSSREGIIEAVGSLHEILERPESTVKEAIRAIASNRLLQLPDVLTDTLGESSVVDLDSEHELLHRAAWSDALNVGFTEFNAFLDYVDGLSEIDTHQGVKGLEFPRVMVILDDSHAGGNWFRYDKIFGAESLSKNDHEKISKGTDSTLSRTLRLLYVACTRAEGSLAVVMYTANPDAARATAISNGWFYDHEIVMVAPDEEPEVASTSNR
jgi:DNA helicase-2/ATP-dependent DNA helicase PcrA